MMQYDMSLAKAQDKNEEDVFEEENIRLSENLSYIFRMFLVSILFIILVLVVST